MASFSDKLYQSSPIWLQQLVVAAYGWWWYRRRINAHFHAVVKSFKEREHWTTTQFQSYQEDQLGRILDAAWNSPYYSQVFIQAGIVPEMPPFEALSRLPFLTKETLRTKAKELLTKNPPPRATLILRSSGTTGTPTDIYYTPEFHALQLAIAESRNLNWAGATFRDRRMMFGSRKVCGFNQDRPPFWRFSPVENMAYASIYHLSPKFLPAYLEFLRSYRPSVIMGYPSALHTVARYALDHRDLPAPAKVVVTTSETVLEHVRETIETAWQCKIFDRYGAVEACLYASQCDQGRYHVSPEIGLIEILGRDGRPVPNGVIGEVICTGLQNMLQPLIRYRIGDAARWAIDQRCPCGREMPILESIEGRFEDICYTPDGREMFCFDSVFKGVKHLREAQVVQEDIDLFSIYVVHDHGFDANDIEKLKNNMRAHIGGAKTRVESVSAIPRSASGKFRAVICKLSQEKKDTLRKRGSFP